MSASSPPSSYRQPASHTLLEDAYGLFIAAMLLAVGMLLLRKAGVVTSGTVGLAVLASLRLPITSGQALALLNLPFFLGGLRLMGWRFVGKSLLLTLASSSCIYLLSRYLVIDHVHPAVAAVVGGTVAGMGALAAARHQAAAGGTLIVALWLQNRFHIAAGKAQLCFDAAIVLASMLLLGLAPGLWTLLSVAMVDLVLLVWHRPVRPASLPMVEQAAEAAHP